jgi:hypothetical protein
MESNAKFNRAGWLVLLLVAMSLPGCAQRKLTFSVGGGPSLPTASFGSAHNTGWHGLASLGLTSIMHPLSLRLDVAHHRLELDDDVIESTTGVTPLTLNLAYRLPLTNSAFSPYLMAGAGAARVECVEGPDCGSETSFVWVAGLGTKVAALRLKWFLETRFTAANTESGNVRIVPVTLGLTF